MTDISLSSDVIYYQEKHTKIIYHLFEHDHHFGIECYKSHCNKSNPMNYCFVDNITEDEDEAKHFVQDICNRQVFPLHIADIATDYFAK